MEPTNPSRRQFLAGAAGVGTISAVGVDLSSVSTAQTDVLDAVVAEVGEVSNATGDWSTKDFSPGLVDAISQLASPEPPVVVAKPPTANGGDPAHVRIRNVTEQSFEYRIEEWDYLDGEHVSETFHYIAVIPGVYNLGDDTVQTGGVLGLEANRIPVSNDPQDVAFEFNQFENGFEERPVVGAQAQTRNGERNAVTTHVDVPSEYAFNVRLQEEEGQIKNRVSGTPIPSAEYYHKTETVGYVAVAQGSGTVTDTGDTVLDHIAGDFEVDRAQLVGNGQKPGAEFETVTFDAIDFDTPPEFISAIQSRNGPEPAEIRYQNLSKNGVDLKIEEERSFDDEANHAHEVPGYLAFESTGLIEGVELL
jgi:hypothetical protein